MLRLLRGIGLLLLTLTTFSQPAQADGWDWLGGLSGPGPSPGRGNLMATIYCRGTNAGRFQTLQDANDKGPCIFADVHRFKSEEDDRFFPVRTEMYEAGPTYRLAPAFEVGVGMGLIHFDSSGVKTNRFILTFPRFVLKPIMFAKSKEGNGNWGFIQIYFSENHIMGELTQDNFNPKPGVKFHTRHDLVPSTGFIVDAVALLNLILKR